jgi:outer membrane beta-barrel protein
MRFKISKRTGYTVAVAAVCLILSNKEAAWSKDKFSRSKPATVSSDAATTGASPSPSKEKVDGANPSQSTSKKPGEKGAEKPSEKVDITDLENRYWTAKDTEFNVVQNRLYTKAKKFSLTPTFGAGFNDPYESNIHLGLALDYYFSEREGVGITGWKTTATDAKLIGAIGSNGAVPDRNIQQSYFGAYYSWIPIYAKLSLLEKKIMYFDMGVSPGLGITNITAATYTTSTAIAAPSAVSQSVVTASVPIESLCSNAPSMT